MNREKINVEYEDRKEKDRNGNLKDMRSYLDKISEIGIDLIKAKKQCRVDIHGIEVYFPYPPYTNQLVYMEKGIYILILLFIISNSNRSMSYR